MGLSDCWIGARADGVEVEAAIVKLGVESLGEAQGWCWGRPAEDADLEAVVSALARDGRAPAVGGWIADSDCAYLVFAAPDGQISARVAINQTILGEPVEGLPDLWRDHGARGAAFQELARWSSEYAVSTVDASSLLREMPGGDGSAPPSEGLFFAKDDPWYDEEGNAGWVFAEDGVRLVYHRLGLPSIDETVFAHPASGSHEMSPTPSSLGWLTVWGGDERLAFSLAERLDSVIDANVQVNNEDLSPDTEYLTRFPRRYPQQDPEWLADALQLIRTWLSETGTERLWVDLNSRTTHGLSLQAWQVTRDDE